MNYVISKRVGSTKQKILKSTISHKYAIFKSLKDVETEFIRLIAYICKNNIYNLFTQTEYSIYLIPERSIEEYMSFRPYRSAMIKKIISTDTSSICNNYKLTGQKTILYKIT